MTPFGTFQTTMCRAVLSIVNGIFFHVTREGDQERTNVEYTLNNDESHLAEEILFSGKKELLNSL